MMKLLKLIIKILYIFSFINLFIYNSLSFKVNEIIFNKMFQSMFIYGGIIGIVTILSCIYIGISNKIKKNEKVLFIVLAIVFNYIFIVYIIFIRGEESTLKKIFDFISAIIISYFFVITYNYFVINPIILNYLTIVNIIFGNILAIFLVFNVYNVAKMKELKIANKTLWFLLFFIMPILFPFIFYEFVYSKKIDLENKQIIANTTDNT